MESVQESVFSNEDISSIRNLISTKELITEEDKHEIKKLITLSLQQDYGLGLLFIKCFDILSSIKTNLKNKNNDYSGQVDNLINVCSTKLDIFSLRNIVQRISRIDGGIGTYHLQRTLSQDVSKFRKEMLDFTSIFIKMGVEE